MKGFLSIFALLIVFTITLSLYGADQAKIVFIKGKGELIRGGQTKAITKGMEVKQNDVIQTKASTTVIVKIKGGTKIKIKENSRLTLSVLNSNKQNKISLQSGGVFAKVDKLRSGEKFEIKSVDTLAGVRGTQFYIHTLKTKDIWLCVNEGAVDVTENKKKSKVTVKEGEGISIKHEDKVGEPKRYKWTKNLNWNMDDDKGKVEDTVDLDKSYDTLDRDYD